MGACRDRARPKAEESPRTAAQGTLVRTQCPLDQSPQGAVVQAGDRPHGAPRRTRVASLGRETLDDLRDRLASSCLAPAPASGTAALRTRAWRGTSPLPAAARDPTTADPTCLRIAGTGAGHPAVKRRKRRLPDLIRIAEARRLFFIPKRYHQRVLYPVTWGHYHRHKVEELCPTWEAHGVSSRIAIPAPTAGVRPARPKF